MMEQTDLFTDYEFNDFFKMHYKKSDLAIKSAKEAFNKYDGVNHPKAKRRADKYERFINKLKDSEFPNL